VSALPDTSRVGSVDVVFLLVYSEAARDHLPVLKELERRGRTCAIGLLYRNAATEAVIAEAGITPFAWSHGEGRFLGQDAPDGDGAERPADAPSMVKRRIRAALEGSSLFDGVQEFRSQRRQLQEGRRFFVRGRCRALVLEADSNPPSLHYAKAARDAGIPSIVIQSHLVPDEGSRFLAGRNMTEPHWRPTGRPALERLVGRTISVAWPSCVRRVGETRVLPRAPYKILSAVALAGTPRSMWFQVGGPATWYAMNGPQAVEVLTREGIPKGMLIPCGQPRVDAIVGSLLDPTAVAQGRARLALPAAGRVAVVATQPWELPGILTREQKVSELRAVCEQLVESGEDVRVLVKPHPKETTEEYAPARVAERITFLPPGSDIMDAIRVADVFLTQRSTSAFFAVAAGKPLLTYNLHGVAVMDHFASMGLSLPIRRADEIPPLMRGLAEGRETPFLTAERRRIVERYIRIDGKATAAVADLIERAIREGA